MYFININNCWGAIKMVARPTKNGVLSCIEADLWRHYGRSGWLLLLFAMFHNRTFSPVATYRVVGMAKSMPNVIRLFVLPLAKILHRWAQLRACMDLPPDVEIGPGFRITHGWGLVINMGSRIGSNVTMMHGVTLGGKNGKAPLIGNNVFIGAHAILLGGVEIGDGVIVGPGSLITKSVPPGMVVVGNPQHVVGPVKQSLGNFIVPSELINSVVVN